MSIKKIIFLRIPPFFGYILHHPHDITLPFTLAYVASGLKQQNYEVKVLDLWANGWSLEKAIKHIVEYKPDLIFYDASTGVIPTLQTLQVRLKEQFYKHKKVQKSDSSEELAQYEHHYLSIVFGSVATYFPDVLFNPESKELKGEKVEGKQALLKQTSTVDIGLSDECEETVNELMPVLEQMLQQNEMDYSSLNNIQGLVYWNKQFNQLVKTPSRPYLRDLDELPSIDYHLFNLPDYRKYSFPIPLFSSIRWGHVLATRGCPYKCSFCSHDHRQSYGRQVRRYSAKRLADEFELLITKYQINAISIEDDIFTVNRDYVFDFCQQLDERHIKVKWVVQTRADVLDATLMKRMKTSGCVGFSLGIESGNDRVLEVLNKEVTRQQLDATIKTAGDLGMMLRLMFMMGNPTETEEDIKDTFSLAMQAKAITVQMHYCTPYPGTDFFDPSKDSLNSLADYSSYNSIYRNMSEVDDERLNELRNSFYHRYYFSWHYLKLFFRQRFIYMLAQAKDELPFVLKALWFLIKKPKDNQKRIYQLKNGLS